MFGNELTEEQQKNSLYQTLGLLAVVGGIQYIKYQDNGKVYSIEELIQEELIEFVSVKKGE